MPDFVRIYHPLIPDTATSPVWVSLSALDDHEAKGWVLVDPDQVPEPAPSPYLTQSGFVSQVNAGTGPIAGALNGAFVSSDVLVLSPNAPTAPAPGTVWINTSTAA